MGTRRTTSPKKPTERAPLERPAAAAHPVQPRAAPKSLPLFLKQAAQDHTVSRRNDPAEREARTIAPAAAREAARAAPDLAEKAAPTSAPASGALPDEVRAPMEAAFGADFSDVRVQADAEAGEMNRALDARAFTVGNEIAFKPDEYRPGTESGRELIAHELTHVIQQRGSTGAGSKPVQCDGPTTTDPEPTSVSGDAADQAQWRGRVDRAVRARFGLAGAALAASQISFVDEAEFGRRFPAGEMEETLLNLFLAHGQDHTTKFYQILDHSNQSFHITGVTSVRSITVLRTFIQQSISQGHFAGQTREYDVTTGQRFPAYRITPGQLIAENVGGVTDIAPDRRGARSIIMQVGAYLDTLVHEVCHFYVSNAFRNMVNARADGGEYLRGARISQILLEGFAEYFAQQVMEANAATFGPSNGVSYPDEVRVVGDLVLTLGESTVRAAYFGGDTNAVARVSAAVDAYKNIHEDLLLPGSMVPARPP